MLVSDINRNLAKYIKEKYHLLVMDDLAGGSVYDVIEVVGTSRMGWEDAIKNAVDTASKKVTNLRITEVVEMDTMLDGGRIMEYRAKVRLSFKHEIEPETF
jgi:flavin-binding protein dodecin